MGRRTGTSIVVTGDGNNITRDSADTITVNGQTHDIPQNGTVVIDGNTVVTNIAKR